MTHQQAVAALEEIYGGLPSIDCQGYCFNSCGPISMSSVERERIRQEHGVEIQHFTTDRSQAWAADRRELNGESLLCNALDTFHRCSVYDVRPFICRVWGVGRGELACPNGCTMTGRRLKYGEIMRLLWRTFRIGGLDDGMNETDMIDGAEEVMADPEVETLLIRYTNGERHLQAEIQQAMNRAMDRLGVLKNANPSKT